MVPFPNGNYKPMLTSSGERFELLMASCFVFNPPPPTTTKKKNVALSDLDCPTSMFLLHLLIIFYLAWQTYQHASAVIQSLVGEDINVKFLVQLDKLIRLLETPIFAYLRLQVHK